MAERTCIATRRSLPRERMLRFVLSPGGEVVFDLKGNLPGRGAWLAPIPQAFEQARATRAFARAFKAPARVPEDLRGHVLSQLARAALDTLSLARGAGEAVAGFEKTRALLKSRQAAVLVQAADGGVHGRRRLRALLKATGRDIPVVESLAATQLGLAFGRGRVIHAAMKDGGLARRFLRLTRLHAALCGAPAHSPQCHGARPMEMEQNGR